jgi:hypothetical protein
MLGLPFLPAMQAALNMLPPHLRGAFLQNFQQRSPWPAGWQRAPLPYTGLGPRRLYMRCAVWPGPQGLVPGYAANMPPGALPGMPGFPGAPGMPVPGGGGRRHRRRRR